jgi:hypothetical protein
VFDTTAGRCFVSTFPYLPFAGIEAGTAKEGVEDVRQFALLAPSPDVFPSTFRRVSVDPEQHGVLMRQMQRLRGSVYLEDGAIQPADLDEAQCHVSPVDARSFHVLVFNRQQQVVGCSRFRAHQADVCFAELTLARAPLAQDPIMGSIFRNAVEQQIASARHRGYVYVELGGWALHSSIRYSTEALRIAALNFSLGLALGGGTAICTATLRNNSAMILRRLGGRPLSYNGFTIPPYYDNRYQCEIDVLTFDSDQIPHRHAQRVEELHRALHNTRVLCYEAPTSSSLSSLWAATAQEVPQSAMA